MRLRIASQALHERHAFRIARPRRTELENVWLTLEDGDFTGLGEAAPNAFYGETAEGVCAILRNAAHWISTLEIHTPEEIAGIWEKSWPVLAPSRAAQCALDLALWDLLGNRLGRSVCELAWGEPPRPVESFATVGLSTPAELAAKTLELGGFPRVKVKLDSLADLAPVRSLRANTPARLAADANCSWSGAPLDALAAELAALGVEFLEQPLPPELDGTMPRIIGGMPIFADESCRVEEDVDRVARHFSGFNIKLVKCGGLTPALRMVRRGRELGCRIMVGCMLESSALIAAGAVIAQRTDYADLDGAWLLADDPVRGWSFEAGVLRPGEGVGLGIAGFAEGGSPGKCI